jgi:hypothetical protein
MELSKFLEYGALGLGLSLAILTYKLIKSEQQKDQPRKSILITVYVFMIFSLTLSTLGFVAENLKELLDRIGTQSQDIVLIPKTRLHLPGKIETGEITLTVNPGRTAYRTQVLVDTPLKRLLRDDDAAQDAKNLRFEYKGKRYILNIHTLNPNVVKNAADVSVSLVE